MKKVLVFVLVFYQFSPANSQVHYGLKSGAAINDFTNQFSSSEKPLWTIQTSVFAKIQLHQAIIFQPSLGYYPKGNKFKESFFVDQYGNVVPVQNEKRRFDFVELTFPFQYIIAEKKTKIAIGLGPFFSYAVSGVVKFEYKPGQSYTEPTNRPIVFGTYGFNRFNAGLVSLLSAFIGKHWITSMNYDQGLTYTSHYGKQKTISVGMTVGYIFK